MKTIVDRPNQSSVLAQWRGARAQIWIFDVSLKRLALRIHRPHEAEVLYVTAVGCKHIEGSFSWEDADVSIKLEPPESQYPTECRIIDAKAGFELSCSDARVVRGPSTDFDKIFDQLLGG